MKSYLHLLATSLLLLNACTEISPPLSNSQEVNPSNQASPPTPEPSFSPEPSIMIKPTPEPAHSSSTEPENKLNPEAAPVTDPTPEPSVQPTPEATPSSKPFNGPVIEKTAFYGKVFDDTQRPLDNVTVKVSSISLVNHSYFSANLTTPYKDETITASGTYSFHNAPRGVEVEIIVSKPGYTKRRRKEILKRTDLGNTNRYDFGKDPFGNGTGSANTALYDRPEVVAITPKRNASGVDSKTAFALTFSEPMNKKTVEDNFVIRSFTQETLSVDNEISVVANPTAVTDDAPTEGTKIWDKNAFTISWNEDDTEVTFTFNNELQLPTDNDSFNAPEYYVSFTNDHMQIKDSTGISRDKKHFKLTDGNFEGAMKFATQTDQSAPELKEIRAEQSTLFVTFSEAMVIPTLSLTIAGGLNGQASQAPAALENARRANHISAQAAAGNYTLKIKHADNSEIGAFSWQDWGGSAHFNATTNTQVQLQPPQQAGIQSLKQAWPENASLDITLLLENGSTESHSIDPGQTPASFQAALNALLEAADFVLHRENEAALSNPWLSDENIRFELTGNPLVNGKKLLALHMTGGSALDVFSDQQLSIYPQTAAGQTPILWRHGSDIELEVAATVLDPAGNPIAEDKRMKKYQVIEQ